MRSEDREHDDFELSSSTAEWSSSGESRRTRAMTRAKPRGSPLAQRARLEGLAGHLLAVGGVQYRHGSAALARDDEYSHELRVRLDSGTARSLGSRNVVTSPLERYTIV